MKIKVCGMQNPENISELVKLPIHYMGLIFYPKSPRYAGGLNPDLLSEFPKHINLTGVFVNEEVENLLEIANEYKLSHIQLHGNEPVEYCKQLKELAPKLSIIKAFNISSSQDFEITKDYKNICDYFLFDTKTEKYGGSGIKFDWNVLSSYNGNTPFFLSGGIDAQDAVLIKQLNHPKLYALDINSKFEVTAGLKNISLLQQFLNELKK